MGPDLGALLAGAGPGPGGPPPGMMGPPPAGPPAGPSGQPVDDLKGLVDLVHQLIGKEPDEEDKAVLAKCLSALQNLLAKDQREQDTAMSGATSPRVLRKAAAGY